MESKAAQNNNNNYWFLIWLIFSLFFMIFLVFGCKPLENTVYVDRFHVRDSIAYDSVYIAKTDSFIREIKGDTVFITKIKFQDKYKIKIEKVLQKDTVNRIIEKPVQVEKIVKIHDSFWWIGIISLLLFILIAIYKVAKLLKLI